jgi:hypothetical protein
MHRYIAVGVPLAALLVIGSLWAADAIESGPQVGKNARPQPFHPLNVTGAKAGQKNCLV